MGASMTVCTELFAFDGADFDYMRFDPRGGPCKISKGSDPQNEVMEQQPNGPMLALRISYAPVSSGIGARPSPFGEGDEVAVAFVDKVKGWEPMGWRQERVARQRAALGGTQGGSALWPDGPENHRLGLAQRFWGARVIASDGNDGFEEHWCLMQVAVNPTDRSEEATQRACEDAHLAASYAHRFNLQTANSLGEGADPEDVPGVKVCIPVACEVLGSTVPDVARLGDKVTLTTYPAADVKKFVFEGCEDFLELPQAFFHYVAWSSGGRELVADVQGMQDDDGVTLVDPVILKAAQTTVSDLLGAAMANATGVTTASDAPEERFNTWHPRCGQLCKGFDAHRRGVHVRRHCGFSTPACGVRGGG